VLDLQSANRGGRDDGRRALLLLEQALLAEDVAGAEVGDLLAAALDADRAVLDGVEVVGVAALLDDRLALGERDEHRERGDLVELALVDVLEEVELLESAWVHLGVSSRSRRVEAIRSVRAFGRFGAKPAQLRAALRAHCGQVPRRITSWSPTA
jgi:hypothetical protein